MTSHVRIIVIFAVMAAMLAAVGQLQSWSVAFAIINMCLVSSIMALGVNIQWGYAGLFNVGIMGFAALGGVAAVIVSKQPVAEAWAAGGWQLAAALLSLVATIAVIVQVRRIIKTSILRGIATFIMVVAGYFFIRIFYVPAVDAIEAVNPAKTGYLGGIGLPIILSWPVGGLFAAGAAWLVGKIALGLRSDYLAIATLGISEIIVAIIKNEDWLTRGVKNVTGLPRPVPLEIDLQSTDWFVSMVARFHESRLAGLDPLAKAELLQQLTIDASSLFVKACYAILFMAVLFVLYTLSQRAQKSPWGRMMRAVRDNEHAANAMGKDVTRRHLQVFVLGSAVVGIAGAMMTTLDGQLTPGTYQPLRYTFLIWVMVIVGGSGNNLGSIVGGFLVWFFWVEAEPLGLWLINVVTAGMVSDSPLRLHLLESAPHMRLIFMGVILLLVLRFSPKGLLPETIRRNT
ncbi:MAG: branched-chain amino acid ABC transporter permease [Granulosicoccus sp.]|nr:branched-chain amino acid ABC transporter permease [Granulosicoccus sp.]